MLLEEKISNLIEGPLNKEKIILDDVRYVKEDGMYFLRVIIDKEPFVDVDTCVLATNIINPFLDELESEFKQAYILDVCSKERKDN